MSIMAGVSPLPLSRSPLIERYHYLGDVPLARAQIRDLISADNHLPVAMDFGTATWPLEPQDYCIGRSSSQCKQTLRPVVNNVRYLILPWIRSKYLALRILAIAANRMPFDWQVQYGNKRVRIETFTLSGRFAVTRYRAANWIRVEKAAGRGKPYINSKYRVPVKESSYSPSYKISYHPLPRERSPCP